MPSSMSYRRPTSSRTRSMSSFVAHEERGMSERVVAFAPSPQRLSRIVTDEAAAGRQVMAAFLNAYQQPGPYAQAGIAPAPMDPAQVMQPITPRLSGAPGQVLACYSPRGGAGTSLLAATLASRIAMNPQLRVLLVDLDLQNG